MTPTSNPYTVEVAAVESSPIAAIPAQTNFAELPATITGLLDKVWPYLGATDLVTGHNVVVYRDFDGESFDVEVGVQVDRAFDPPAGHEVRSSQLPTGRTARTEHWGDYGEVHCAHVAVQQWCEQNGHTFTATNWEIYGDWSDDPAKRLTEVLYLLDD